MTCYRLTDIELGGDSELKAVTSDIQKYFFCCNSPQWVRASSFTRFLDHTQRRTTVGRNPLDQESA